MEARNVIVRHSYPTVLDESPYGTACIVKHIRDFDIYVQTNNNSEMPHWELIGNFPHSEKSSNQELIDKLIDERLN